MDQVDERKYVYSENGPNYYNNGSTAPFFGGGGLRTPVHFLNPIHIYLSTRPPLWSSDHSSWLQIRRPGFDFRHYQKKKVVGLERGSTQPREYN
jgi:hypothetical protein